MSCRLDPTTNSREAQRARTPALTAFLTVCRNKPVEKHHSYLIVASTASTHRQRGRGSKHTALSQSIDSPQQIAVCTLSLLPRRPHSIFSLCGANYVTHPLRPTSTPLSSLVATVRLSAPSTRERRAYTSGLTPANLREGRRETAVGLWPVPAVLRPKSARRPPN